MQSRWFTGLVKSRVAGWRLVGAASLLSLAKVHLNYRSIDIQGKVSVTAMSSVLQATPDKLKSDKSNFWISRRFFCGPDFLLYIPIQFIRSKSNFLI